MTRVQVGAATDVGQVRSANEDAFLTGDSVFAVADGMGGHAAGEVASSLALEPVRELDGRLFVDAGLAVEALRDAVLRANTAVARRAREDDSLKGMGTTLTSAMVEGRRLHIAHVGDSRAYLARNHEFSQITDDHTLVQHLIDAGQITRDEAASHPQRSVITRAIGVTSDIVVDTISIELQPGDTVLLCSDGLTGVVGDSLIQQVLTAGYSPSDAAQELVDLANERGGPDNITVVVLRGYDDEGEPPPSVPRPSHRGTNGAATDTGTLRVSSAAGSGRDEPWAEGLGRLGTNGDGADGPRSGSTRVIAIAIAAALTLVMLVGGGRWLLARSYYVGIERGQVAIFQGVSASIGPLDLSWIAETSDLSLSEVAAYQRDDLAAGITAADLTDARRIIANMPLRGGAVPDPSSTPTPSPTSSPTTTATTPAPSDPSTSPSPSPSPSP